jgi:hypothetical protein
MFDNILADEVFLAWSLRWSVLWVVLLALPPGISSPITAYRYHFVHAVIACFVALPLYNMGLVEPQAVTSITITYFAVDFLNILLQDFVFKVRLLLTLKSCSISATFFTLLRAF